MEEPESTDPKVLLTGNCKKTAECLFYKNILKQCSKKLLEGQSSHSNCIEEFFKHEKCIDSCVSESFPIIVFRFRLNCLII